MKINHGQKDKRDMDKHNSQILIRFYDSMSSFLVEANMCRFFYRLFIYVLPLEILLSRREGGDPINWFNPAKCLFLMLTKDLYS
jgi:hypothetical protein